MSPPMYPEDVLNARGRGDVLLLVQVGRDGKVLDVATEQVNLRVIANEAIMRKMRDKLARVSMGAARKWTFKAPSTGNEKDEASWTVRFLCVSRSATRLSATATGTPIFLARASRHRGAGTWP